MDNWRDRIMYANKKKMIAGYIEENEKVFGYWQDLGEMLCGYGGNQTDMLHRDLIKWMERSFSQRDSQIKTRALIATIVIMRQEMLEDE
jgi:hypothetical protein